VVQWERFEKDWNRARETEGFNVFHMSKFVSKNKPFDSPEWHDQTKRDRLLARLINIVRTRASFAFFSAVDKSAYDEVIPDKWKKDYILGENHYTFAVRMCLARVRRWREKYGHTGPVQFMFDRMTKGHGEIMKVFEQSLEEGEEQALTFGISKDGYSFQDRAVILPLQAADILAWETLRHMQAVVLAPEGEKKPIRRSFAEILKTPHGDGWHDRQTLTNLANYWRSAGIDDGTFSGRESITSKNSHRGDLR
jgi:hypothetical protein